MRHDRSLLVAVLLNPGSVRSLDTAGWELLIRQARSAQLLARLAVTLIEADLLDATPTAPRRHLCAILEVQLRQQQAVRWEVEHLVDALAERAIPLVLLKGAAYVMAGLKPGRCRLFADLDVLVPRARLGEAELALMLKGWASGHHDAYDERYYRTWMHELPPMRHIRRMSVVDVHHNLIPDTAPLHPDAAKLLAAAVPCPDRSDVFVLAPHDMILHSAVHLFNDGEFDHALRDLFDLYELVELFVHDLTDWQTLIGRAIELDLGRPLFYAQRYLARVLELDMPAGLDVALGPLGPGAMAVKVLDALFERALQPDHVSCRSPAVDAARSLLYLRGHTLRMPPHLLVPHLVRKSLMRLRDFGEVRVVAQAQKADRP